MDQFGVLVESIGFKSQGQSAPLADLKGKTNLGFNSAFNPKPSSNSVNGSFGDDLDRVFGPNNNSWKPQNNSNGFDDVFGGSNTFDLNNSGARSGFYDNGDDIFGGFSGSKNQDSMHYDDVFGNMGAPPKRSDSVDDLLGSFANMGPKPNGMRRDSGNTKKNGSEFDDLIPGFGGGSSPSSDGSKSGTSHSQHSSGHSAKSNKILVEDPFKIFESQSTQRNSTSTVIPDPFDQVPRKDLARSSIDELEDFVTGRTRNDANEQSDFLSGEKVDIMRGSENVNDLEYFFSRGVKPTTGPSPISSTEDSVYDALFQKPKRPPVPEQTKSGTSTTKKTSVKNMDDDFLLFLGVGVAPPSGEFQEVEGESEERRRARLNIHQKTQERMRKALDDKNQRDLQAQQEQEERHRIAGTMDDDIKRWAAGKEGNLRALLSSLQCVLWAESGWQPVSLTDLITSISVKKAYQKATLYVHPDKVQQRGANLQQKYIAEKVFDLLKEAWTKFSSEEL